MSTIPPFLVDVSAGTTEIITIEDDDEMSEIVSISDEGDNHDRPHNEIFDHDHDDDDDDEDDDDDGWESDTTIPSTSDESEFTLSSSTLNPLKPPNVSADRYTGSGFRLGADDSVEVREQYQRFRKGDFMLIKRIVHNLETDEISLEGYRIRRNTQLEGMLPMKLNEVFMMVELDDPARKGLESIPVVYVLKKRRIVLTNQDYPACSFREHTAYHSNNADSREVEMGIRNGSELVCRWMLIRSYKIMSAANGTRTQKRISEEVLRRVQEDECTLTVGIPETILFASWHGDADLAHDPYTVCDGFAGAGGVSEGAEQAGLKVVTAFDCDEAACLTYTQNRPDVVLYRLFAHQYAVVDDGFVVSVLHLSPPCKAFSIAYTRPGKNDEDNQAALCSVHAIVRKLRPRVVTLEQVSNLNEARKHQGWSFVLISQLTDLGYSVRWKTRMDFAELGLSQHRKRLILLASCPGGVLPRFPEATHGDRPGLQPYVTIAQCLSAIPSDSTHNDPAVPPRRDLPAYSANTQLRACITAGGCLASHPNGRRDFTVRELASLQSFPADFEFGDSQTTTNMRAQIGNAVPPVVAKALFTAVRRALEAEDRARANASS